MEGTTPLLPAERRGSRAQQQPSRSASGQPRRASTRRLSSGNNSSSSSNNNNNNTNRTNPDGSAPVASRVWFVQHGDQRDHYKVWNLVVITVFPCMGAFLFGFDFGAFPWVVSAPSLLPQAHSQSSLFVVTSHGGMVRPGR
jgi:hypothetical protein